MGAAESVPNPDHRTLRMMEFMQIGVKELGVFWKHFRKGDKEMLGVIQLDDFYELFHEKRSIFGDGLFDLTDIHHAEELDFGEYLVAVITYCLFEPQEILRFCFYIFDRDKNGYIMREELELMLRVLYHIVPPDEFTGNTRNALDLLEFHDDEKVDWREFNRFHVLFPALFYPAFRMQDTMIKMTMGQRWWDKKKRILYNEKVRRDMIDQLALRKEHNRLLKLREKRVRKNMGLLRYMCCPAQRAAFRKLFPVDDAEAERSLSEAELQAQKAKQREVERRLRELDAKNPETPAYKDYQKRKTRIEYAQLHSDPVRPRRLPHERADRAKARRADKVAAARAD